jgi:tetratricopeptide (TPR) repeat protein
MKNFPAILKKIKPPKFSINSLNDKLGIIFSFSTKLLILISIIVVIILLLQELFVPQTFRLSGISVPNSFAEKGYSSEVLGSRLSDKLNDIVKTGSESLEVIESIILKEDKEKSYQRSADLSSFEIQVGLFNLSITEVILFLREKLGYKNIIMDGDLTEENTSLTFSMRLKANGELIKYNRLEEYYNDDLNDKYYALDELINKTGEFVIFYNDPIILLSYYISEKREEITDSLFRKITYDDYFDDQIKLWTYVIWGHTLFIKADEIYYNTFEIDKELYEAAISKYDKALETDPEFVTSIGWNMAYYYIEDKQYSKANEIYNKILEIDKKNIDAHYFLAENYNILNEKEKAINSYIKVSKLDPDGEKGLNALTKIAEIYKSTSNFNKTKEYYNKVLNNKNADEFNLTTALSGYGDILTFENKYDEALVYYVKASKYNKNSDFYLKIAESYAYLNDTVAFANYLKLAIDEGYELNDSILNSPLYIKYKNSELMKFLIDEYVN